MKNKNLMRFCLFGLLVVLFFSPCLASDDTTLVVFSRHTFRGISTNVAPQKIFLRQYGVNPPIPSLSYGENATPQGLIIAESFAAPGLQEAAALAVGAIAENKVFDGHWDEVRAELAAERTFWTGLYLIKGLKEQDPQHKRAIPFTGCPFVPAKDKGAVDAVSSDHPVMKCVVTVDDSSGLCSTAQSLAGSAEAESKLSTFSEYGARDNRPERPGGDSTPVYSTPPPTHDPKLPREYNQIAALASIIEMIAELVHLCRKSFRL